jgi:hypothetical protein
MTRHAPKPRTGMHTEIATMLEGRTMSAYSVATAKGWPLHAVESCMRSMARREELVRLKCKPGQWARYRVRGGV